MKRKNKNKKLTLLLVLVLLISVGYAALASNLKINGTSSVKSATWDVYWNNVQINPESVSTTTGNQARITDQAKTQVEYSVTLNEPGDFYEFTVDAVNNGTIDAMIASQGIVNGVYSDSSYTTPATLPDAVSYTVTYEDGTEIQEKHLLAKKNGNTPTTETYKVRIEYRNDGEIDPDDLDNNNDQTYYFKFSVDYVQADNTKVARNGGSSSNEQGNSNETIPTQKTWNYYNFLDEESYGEATSEFNNSWVVWTQENTDTNDVEVCRKIDDTTICVEPGHYTEVTCNGDNCSVSEYLSNIKTELESHDLECDVSESQMNCSNILIYNFSEGYAEFDDDSGAYCAIYGFGPYCGH